MKRVLLFLALLIAIPCSRFAQTTGAFMPAIPPAFTNASGIAAAGAKLCTIKAGTATTWQATYTDSALATPLPNPITLNAIGQPTTNGSTTTAIYLSPSGGGNYKMILYAAGIGNSCNGTTVGAVLWTRDNVYDLGELIVAGLVTITSINNQQFCKTGADATAMVIAAIALLPSTGGIVNCSNLQGSGQAFSTDPFGGTSKPIQLLLGAATFTASATIKVPANSSITGLGRSTKIVAASSSAPTGELVQLSGDYSSISNCWLSGSGQVANTVDGHRGIWIGSTASPHTGIGNVNYARVENMIIDQFTGNGISGDYTYATIVNNLIQNTTDAGIFLQPTATFNLVQGNTVSGAKYSCIDINGSDNRISNNNLSGCGGGNVDANSQSCLLITAVAASSVQPNAMRNIVESNRASSCVQAGYYVYVGGTTSGTVNSLGGNLLRGNIATGMTNAYNQNANVTLNSWNGGFVVIGADSITIEGNVSSGNTFNYVITGITNNTSKGCIVANNQSYNAATNAAMTGLGKPSGVGYLFTGSARLDAVGGSPATDCILKNNMDRYSAAASYRWSLDGAASLNWSGWTISGNHSDGAGTYAFLLSDPANFSASFFNGDNYAINASSGSFSGFSTYNGFGLTANSATPSVANGITVYTQNTTSTTITNFTGATPGQAIVVRVADVNTTFGFASGNLKGNAGVNFIAYTGDILNCVFDGTNWNCTISPGVVSGIFANGIAAAVTQQTNKSTTVASNTLGAYITMNNAQLLTATTVSFTWTNSFITADSVVLCSHSRDGTAGAYTVTVFPTAGSGSVSVRNITAGNLSEAITLYCRVFPVQ